MGNFFEEDDDDPVDLAAVEARHAEMEAEAEVERLETESASAGQKTAGATGSTSAPPPRTGRPIGRDLPAASAAEQRGSPVSAPATRLPHPYCQRSR